jgi:hypothetical protein
LGVQRRLLSLSRKVVKCKVLIRARPGFAEKRDGSLLRKAAVTDQTTMICKFTMKRMPI